MSARTTVFAAAFAVALGPRGTRRLVRAAESVGAAHFLSGH